MLCTKRLLWLTVACCDFVMFGVPCSVVTKCSMLRLCWYIVCLYKSHMCCHFRFVVISGQRRNALLYWIRVRGFLFLWLITSGHFWPQHRATVCLISCSAELILAWWCRITVQQFLEHARVCRLCHWCGGWASVFIIYVRSKLAYPPATPSHHPTG